MAPGGARRRDARWQRRLRRGAQPVERREDGGGLVLVAGAELGVVVVPDVTRLVLEAELAERPERRSLPLLQLAASIRRTFEQCLRPAPRADEWPQRKGEGREAEDQGRDEDPRHGSASVSRRMRSRIAGSTLLIVAVGPGRRVHRETRTPTIAKPTATAASGAAQTRMLNPLRRGARRIHSP